MSDDQRAWLLALERIWLGSEQRHIYQQSVAYLNCRRGLRETLTRSLADDKVTGHDETTTQ